MCKVGWEWVGWGGGPRSALKLPCSAKLLSNRTPEAPIPLAVMILPLNQLVECVKWEYGRRGGGGAPCHSLDQDTSFLASTVQEQMTVKL